MDVLIMVLQLLAGLSILVIVHEFGHFIAARAFGMRVDKFYLFFDAYGKKLFSFKHGDTEYGIGWLPLGGYVKISGMVDESMDKDQLAQEPQPHEFRSKPAWQRLIVMLGGIILNIILGYIIFSGKLAYFGETQMLNTYANNHYGIAVSEIGAKAGFQDGDKVLAINDKPIVYMKDFNSNQVIFSNNNSAKIIRDGQEQTVQLAPNMLELITESKREPLVTFAMKTEVDSVLPESAAEKAGLKKGDVIIAINDTSVNYYHKMSERIIGNRGNKIDMLVQRGTDTVAIAANVSDKGTLGFINKIEDQDQLTEKLHYGLGESFLLGFSRSGSALYGQIAGIKALVTGKINAMKSLTSPIGIAKIYGAEFDWFTFWTITGLLSFVLAIMNLLPIPALDGGHCVFLLVEMVRGKPLSDKALMRAQVVGFVIIMGLMVLAVSSDLFFK